MPNRLVSVGDDFTLPAAVKVANTNLPAHVQPAALSATYAPKGLETSKLDKTEAASSYVTVNSDGDLLKNGTIVPLANLYANDPLPMQAFKSRLQQTVSGTGRADILCIGDSITAGEGAATSQTVGSFPGLLRKALADAAFPAGGSGWQQPWANLTAGSKNSEWGTTGTWAPPIPADSNQASLLSTNVPGATATFQSTATGTTLDFTLLANSRDITYQVDDLAPVSRPFSGSSAQTYVTISVTGLPDTTHKLVITAGANASVATPVHVGPARVTKASGFTVTNAGVGGARSSSWQSTATSYLIGPTTLALNPTVQLLVIESMLVNDKNVNISAATHKTNLTNIINNYRVAGKPSILLVIPGYTTTMTTAEFDAYRTVIYQVAAETGARVVDIAKRWKSYAAGSALGYYADTAHPSAAGYKDIAKAVAAAALA